MASITDAVEMVSIPVSIFLVTCIFTDLVSDSADSLYQLSAAAELCSEGTHMNIHCTAFT